MITLIWFIWTANQFLCLIILLNFLIAIISQSYEQVMTKKKIVKYLHRSELNRECFLFFKAYRFLSRYLKDQSDFNIIYIWSSTASSDDDNEDWLGVA